ncbi:hypothetical protein [Inhella proteolytica]|uniref:Uncharacterized protein n=1 Tax=Inhella proteolytica TaxID=2795029 RepID=A0A931J3I5_9BURK|nr:hypothetical protein [Inhella proteolytica]MBH9576884.1 hypothetical protein [Inhella proteolytica]
MNTQNTPSISSASSVLSFLSGSFIEPAPLNEVSEDWGVEVPYLFFMQEQAAAEAVAA